MIKTPEKVKRVMNYQINVSRLLLILILVVGTKFGWDYYSSLQTELAITKQNNKVLKDSVRTTVNKLDEAVYSKQIFVAKTKKDLKILNDNLAKTIKNFNGKVHEISILEAKIDGLKGEIDKEGDVIDLSNGEKGITWDFSKKYDKDNSRELAGITKFKINFNTGIITPISTEITKDKINFKLTQGLRTTKDGKVEMFASSNYPGFSANSLNSVIVNPKTHPALTQFTNKKKWHLGVYGGYGATANLSTSEVTVGPQIGFGVQYTIW